MPLKKINSGRVLIIPDIHQNLKFLDSILEKEKDWDYIVFLGDYFDSKLEVDDITVFSKKAVCQWINYHWKLFRERAIWLVGNHDIAYLSTYTKSYNIDMRDYHKCSGWTKKGALKFNKHIDPEWINSLELCCKVGDYYLSHAGFHDGQFEFISNIEESIEVMYDSWESEKKDFHKDSFHWISNAGYLRGGKSKVGSPVWLDWNWEFKSIDGVKQLVGHTRGDDIREENGSFCIDCKQKMYSVWENGKLEFKNAYEN